MCCFDGCRRRCVPPKGATGTHTLLFRMVTKSYLSLQWLDYGPSVAFLERKNKRYKLLNLNERKQGLFSLFLLVVYQASGRPFLKTKNPSLNFTNHVLLHSRVSNLGKIHYLHYLCVEYPSKPSSPCFPEIFLGTWSQSKNSSIWCKATSIAYSRLFSGQKTKNNVLAADSMIYNLFFLLTRP